jgi:hypothetical protein
MDEERVAELIDEIQSKLNALKNELDIEDEDDLEDEDDSDDEETEDEEPA